MSLKDLENIKKDIKNKKDWRLTEPIHIELKEHLRGLENHFNFKYDDNEHMLSFIDALLNNKESYPDQMALGLKYYLEVLASQNKLNERQDGAFLEEYKCVLDSMAYCSQAYNDSKKYYLEDERPLEIKTQNFLDKHYEFNVHQYASKHYLEYYKQIEKDSEQDMMKPLKNILNKIRYNKQEYPLVKEQINLFYTQKVEHDYLKVLALINKIMALKENHRGLGYLLKGGAKKEIKDIEDIKNMVSNIYHKDITILNQELEHFKNGNYIEEPKKEEVKVYTSTLDSHLGIKTYTIK